MLYECQHDGVRAKGRSRRYAQFAQNITNDHSHYWDTCGGPVIKRLCFSVVLRNSTQWSLGPQHYDNCDPMGKRTPTSVRRRSSRVDFRLRNPSSPDVVFVMKALFSILDPQNRVKTNTCFVFAHDFVLAVRYLLFFFVAYLYYSLHQNFCDASFSRMADYKYNIVTPPGNLSKLKKTDSQNFP